MTKQEIDDRLNDLLLLEKGWNSYGSETIDMRAFLIARSLVLNPVEHIIPMVSGGILLIWGVGSDSLEVEITPNGEISGSLD
jgi:hypothetical protein